jgi:hypothetical protein
MFFEVLFEATLPTTSCIGSANMVNFPFTSRKIVAIKKSTDFRDATRIESFEVTEPKDRNVVIEIHYVGVNASDINFTAGQYVLFDEGCVVLL